MKLRNLLFACLFTIGLSSFASANDPVNKPSVREEIKLLIEKAEIKLDSDEAFTISFLINSNNEIIVVSTSDNQFDNTLRSILHLHKVKSNDLKPNAIYTLPIKMKKK